MGLQDQRLPGSLAVKVVKIIKTVEEGRDLLFEVMEKQWKKQYEVDYKTATGDVKEKMDTEFVKEALKLEVYIPSKLLDSDLEYLNLTLEEAVFINKIMEEK